MKVTDFLEQVPRLDVQIVGDFPDVDEADIATARVSSLGLASSTTISQAAEDYVEDETGPRPADKDIP